MCCKQFITHIILVAAEGLWHLGSLFYHDTQYSQRGCLQIYFGVIFHKTRHLEQAHITSGAFMHCATSLAVTNRDGSAFGLMISLATVCYGDSQVPKLFLLPHLVLQPICGWGDLGSFQLPQSNSSPEGA